MAPSADQIADCVLSTFDALPAKRKPRQRDDGSREWIPLSGIVLSRGDDEPLVCASLATGMKCLPRSKLPLAHGAVLHDWHAEILAIRAFNRRAAAADGGKAEHDFQPYDVRDGVGIHMYCSEAPCGDASMELVMREQEDDTPWPVPSSHGVRDLDGQNALPELRGRGYFSELGVVRRKPARPDAPVTWSKSCTDKLAMKQCTSLLSATTSLLINPRNAYLTDIVLPSSQHVPTAIERAFSPSGRMSSITPATTDGWKGGYRFLPFNVASTSREFTWSRRSGVAGQIGAMLPSNISAVYTPRWQETLIGGVLQGRKQFDPNGASRVCRLKMWSAVADVAKLVAVPLAMQALQSHNYREIKNHAVFRGREMVKIDAKKDALRGWLQNHGDDEFDLGQSEV